MPPASGDPSSPRAWRSISAPDIRVLSARSASASAAAARSAWSSATQRPPTRTRGRASAARRRMSAALSSTSSKTAVQRTSASWLAPTAVVPPSAQSRSDGRRGAPRERRHAHVEAGVAQHRADLGHEFPGLGLAEHDLAAAQAARSLQRLEEPLEAHQVGLHLASLVAGVHQRDLHRREALVAALGEHRQVPRVAGVGRVELHHQRAVGLAGHRRRPAIEGAREVADHAGGSLERGTVEVGQQGLGQLVGRAGLGRGGGHLDALGRVTAHHVDDLGEHRSGHGGGVDVG